MGASSAFKSKSSALQGSDFMSPTHTAMRSIEIRLVDSREKLCARAEHVRGLEDVLNGVGMQENSGDERSVLGRLAT